MTDPIGAISLAITLVQGAYKAYGIHKLTEAFGRDFRTLQRRFETQMGLLRIQAYRLRQATLLGLTGDSTDEKEWLAQIRGLILEIKLNVETCQTIAQKYLEGEFGETLNALVISERIAESTPPVSSTQTQTSGSNTKASDAKTAAAIEQVENKVDKKSPKRRWYIINRLGRKKVEDEGEQNGKPVVSDKKNLDGMPSQVVKETELSQKQNAEEGVSALLQGQTKYKSKLKWVTADKQTYLEHLHLIAEDVGYLREYVDVYIQSPTTALNTNAAIGHLSRLPTDRARAMIAQSQHAGDLHQARGIGPWNSPVADDDLAPLEDSLYDCQEAFGQLCLDMKFNFSVKLCYDHSATWRHFRPYRGVRAREDSILFTLYTQYKTPSNEGVLLVMDTPTIRRGEKRTLKRASLERHLQYRIQTGDIIEEIARSINFDRSQLQEYACLGSMVMNIARPFLIPQNIVPPDLRDKGKQALRTSTCSKDVRRVRDSYFIVSEDDSSGTESSAGASVKENPQEEPTGSSSEQKQDAERILTEEEYSLLQKPVLYHVYQDHKSRWIRHKTLDELLEEEKFQDQKFANTHLRLALLVISNYLSLGANGRARIFRPVDCIYYTTTDEKKILSHEELLLSPYLQMPVDPSNHPTGLSCGIVSTKRTALLELGLFLYQIGSWRRLLYDHPDGLLGMVQDVVTNLTAVTNHTGPLLASVIQCCLTEQARSKTQFTMWIPAHKIRDWPRYGDESTYRTVKNFPRSSDSGPETKTLRLLKLFTDRPPNEVLEICHFVLRPLQVALYNAGLLQSTLGGEDVPGIENEPIAMGIQSEQQRPTYIRVHKDHIDVNTLRKYDVRYIRDQAYPNHIILPQYVPPYEESDGTPNDEPKRAAKRAFKYRNFRYVERQPTVESDNGYSDESSQSGSSRR